MITNLATKWSFIWLMLKQNSPCTYLSSPSAHEILVSIDEHPIVITFVLCSSKHWWVWKPWWIIFLVIPKMLKSCAHGKITPLWWASNLTKFLFSTFPSVWPYGRSYAPLASHFTWWPPSHNNFKQPTKLPINGFSCNEQMEGYKGWKIKETREQGLKWRKRKKIGDSRFGEVLWILLLLNSIIKL